MLDFSVREECGFVHNIAFQDQCSFVRNNSDCQGSGGFVNYIDVYFCVQDHSSRYGLLGALGLWLIMLFVGLGISAQNFFCPNLATMANSLRLSHNVAGVTLLAFGNGAADIFSSFAAVSQGRHELVIGELFGSATFLSTFVAGSICAVAPFKMMERPFIRDVLFCLSAGFFAFWVFYNRRITIYESLGFLLLYVIYFLVVIVGRWIHSRIRARRVREDDRASLISEDVSIFAPDDTRSIRNDDGGQEESDDDSSQETPPVAVPDTDLSNMDDSMLISSEYSPWSHFVTKLAPIDKEVFLEGSLFKKMWLLVKAPVFLLLNLTIPVVNEEERMGGWCQKLHAIQLVISIPFICVAFHKATEVAFGIPVWFLCLTVGQTISLILLFFTSARSPPKFHSTLAFIGFLIAMGWIFVIASEIVALMKLIGVLWGMSDALLGLTILAWGNSISDMVSDTAMAHQGFPRMGFSACYGGPLFNMLLGLGLPFTLIFLQSGVYELTLDYNPMVLVLIVSLGVALLTSLIMAMIRGFKACKWHGLLLIGVYVCIIISALIVELTVIA